MSEELQQVAEVPAPEQETTAVPVTETSTPEEIAAALEQQAAEQLAQRRAALSCTPRQARLALSQQGLLAAVEAFVAAGSDALRIEWQYATEIRRTWPPVAEFAVANDLSDEALDALFELAATL